MEKALTRIESALARIGAAAACINDNARANGGDLTARHEALRGVVGDALQHLDALIGSGKDSGQ